MSKLLLFLLGLAFAFTAKSQFNFQRISTDDAVGLHSNNIYSTYQDRQGFIWVATANGLQRFDGNRFVHFGASKPAPNELPLTAIAEIVPESNHSFWLNLSSDQKIGVFNTRSYTFKQARVQYTRPMERKPTVRLFRDSEGNVFLFVWKYGVLRYHADKNAFVEDGFLQLPGGWIPTNYVYEDKLKKRLWMPCPDSGMAVYSYEKKALYTKHHNPERIPHLELDELRPGVSEVFIDKQRRHWIFRWTIDHFYHVLDEKGRPLKDTTDVRSNPEYSELRFFFQSSRRQLWLYGMNALFHHNSEEGRLEFLPQNGSENSTIRYKHINHIMEDRDGITWFSTDNGLYYLTPYGQQQGVMNRHIRKDGSNVVINDVLQLGDGSIWLSTWGRGVLAYDAQWKPMEIDLYRNVPNPDFITHSHYFQTWTFCATRKGKIWVGCQGGKYIIYDPLTKTSTFSILKETDGATLRYITEDHKGQLWFGSQRGHLIRYDGKSFQVVQKIGTIIRRILADHEGMIWVATEGQGLYCFYPDGRLKKHFSHTDAKDPLFNSMAFDLEQLNDSTIVCAAGTLNFINRKTGRVHWVGFENGLPGNTAMRIRKDARGFLWINTMDGLCRYNPWNQTITQYGKKDGISAERLTYEADYLTREGTMIFAGNSYVVTFKPELFEDKGSPPAVAISNFQLFDKYLLLDSLLSAGVSLAHDQNSFTVSFSALSFLQKEKILYFYRMIGVSDEWRKAGREQELSFSLLPPGRYVLELYSQNIDGIRSSVITRLPIYIQPPFWKRWWFIALIALSLVALAYYFYRLRINKLLAVEAIRSRVARDLHDDMGSTLSTINILGSMAKTRLQVDSVKTSEYISKITENSQRMMEAMDDIVWSIKPDNDTVQKIIVRMKEFAFSVLEAKDITVRMIIDEKVGSVKLNMEARRDFFLIFKEAVNNAAKYSKASLVTIHLACHQRRLLLTIKDDGIGFDPAKAMVMDWGI